MSSRTVIAIAIYFVLVFGCGVIAPPNNPKTTSRTIEGQVGQVSTEPAILFKEAGFSGPNTAASSPQDPILPSSALATGG
jgi:hypothetical protein